MRKSRVNLPNRCYHLISRVAHRAFFLDDEERTRLMGSGDSPRVGIFRRHPERIFQWAENRSVPAENNMSERGVRRTVIARKVCMRWTRASASLTCSSRCRHTRQNSVGDGRRPVAFRKSGEKPHMPFRQWEDPESRLRLRTRRLEKLRCTFAQMLRCRGRSRPRQRF